MQALTKFKNNYLYKREKIQMLKRKRQSDLRGRNWIKATTRNASIKSIGKDTEKRDVIYTVKGNVN